MRTTGLATGLASLLLLAACGGQEQNPEQRAQAEGESAERIERALETDSGTSSANEDAILTAARGAGQFDAVSDAALLTAGRETCGALDRGVSPLEVAATAYEGSDSSGEAGMVILGAAASTLCREHLAAVTELAESLGG
jgi:hypothetical protein